MKKIAFLLTTISLVILNLAGCNDPIFYNINKEVELADPTVFGEILTIVRNTETETVKDKETGEESEVEKEYLYISNGEIMRKDVTETTPENAQRNSSRWYGSSKPSGYINFVAADSTSTLYAISISFEKDQDEGEMVAKGRTLYANKNSSDWEKVDIELPTKNNATIALFSTNNPIKANRKAFLNSNGNIYELEDGAAKLIFDLSKATKDGSTTKYDDCFVGDYTAENNLTTYSRSAIVWGGKVYFYSNSSSGEFNTSNLITTNEIAKNEKRNHSENIEATKIYFVSGSDLYYCDDNTKNPFEKDSSGKYVNTTIKSDIGSRAYSISATADSVLLGTNYGIKRIALIEGEPAAKTSEFATNAASALSSSYSVLTMLVVDSSLNETDCEVYTSTSFEGSSASTSAQFNRVALWSYYKERHNWNRE